MDEFRQQTKAEWAEKVVKDLKLGSQSELDYHVEPGLKISPIYMSDEVTQYPPIRWGREGWKITEDFTITDFDSALYCNQAILSSLEGGSEVIEIIFKDQVHYDIETMLENVHLDLIKIRFITQSDELVQQLVASLEKEAPAAYNHVNCEVVGHTVKLLSISAYLSYSEQLIEVRNGILHLFSEGKINGWKELVIAIPVGDALLIEIAKLRALKLVIYELAARLDKPLTEFPTIKCVISQNVNMDDLETVIGSTNSAFAAVMGGCDELQIAHEFSSVIKLADADRRRVIRNINWLLKAESYMDKYSDVLHGSYWVERCTRLLYERSQEQ